MEIRDIWLWILEQETNKELSILCSKIGATIQGFRNNKVTDRNRQLVIRNLLTPKSLNRLKEIGLKNEVQELSLIEQPIDLKNSVNLEEIKKIIRKLLVTNQEEEAKELYHLVVNRTQIKSENEELQIEDDVSTHIEINKNDTGKIKKLEKKIEKLKKHHEVELNRLKEKIHRLEEENHELIEDIKNNKNDKSELQNKIVSLIEEKEREEIEKKSEQKKIEEFKMQYGRLYAKIAHLEDQIKQQNGGVTKVNGGVELALVGNPRNEMVYMSPRYNITILDGNDVDLLLLDKFEEVWILGYKVPLTRQRKWNESSKKPILLIETFTELIQRLEVEC